ncbi:hypothetical protein ACFX1X_004742 [Malus domestica]
MESQGLSLENYISAWGLTNSTCNQMVLRAAVDLSVFNILSNSGPGAHLTAEESLLEFRLQIIQMQC